MAQAGEWERATLVEHVRDAHGDEPESVEQVYPDLREEVFAPEPPEDDSTGNETRSGPAKSTETLSEDLLDSTYGKKWFLVGVGGAGNNILDAILLRRETLAENNERRARIWEGGLAGYGLLNTNVSELEQTYYAQEEKGYSRNDLLPNCIIGFGRHDYAGAGYRWDIGKELMEADFEGDSDPFRERWDMKIERIQDSQAVMFVHSVTKGTGCGATPVVADNLRSDVLEDDTVVPKPLFSSVVIPSEGTEYSEFGGRAKVNGVVGLARTSRAVDAIIPFDNNCLENVQADIRPQIDRLAEYNPPQYTEINRPLVAFLEAFTMSSVPQFLDQDATMSIMGDVFDPADSFRPVEDKYQLNPDVSFTPAVILAPILGRSRASVIDRSKLEILVRNALFQNKLAEFDPTTAWGGTFLVYGPPEKMDAVSDFVGDGTLTEIISGEEFLDAGNVSGIETVDVHVKQLVTPDLDDVHLWGTLWNPEMPSLSEMYDQAQRLKQEGNSEQAENVREEWDAVEALFSALGRENMA
ncbi:cell division protein FtsZ [Natrinema sp. SYSU A 869]|uniref:cell division protein FtsZ n=1 Tax=Natrinema sp. SYSU A 869 TaxID=2871694 RepID=UPI0021032ACF|nr:cell division protein FtsZ [Natrinema sp. SYSU A 869]